MRVILIYAAALMLSACAQKGAVADRCVGRQELTPKPATRNYIVANDAPFGKAVAFNNATGRMNGCW